MCWSCTANAESAVAGNSEASKFSTYRTERGKHYLLKKGATLELELLFAISIHRLSSIRLHVRPGAEG
jgi:hypothetical protein